MQATEKQRSYILSLQGKLGRSTRYVDVKAIYGKNPIGFQLTKAKASEIIDRLLRELQNN